MDISVIIPLFNEEESLPELYAWIERVMKANGYSFEVILFNDGSTDGSWQVIQRLGSESEHVKGIKFRRNYGKSPALYCGFKQAQGNVVITMEGLPPGDRAERASFPCVESSWTGAKSPDVLEIKTNRWSTSMRPLRFLFTPIDAPSAVRC